VNPQLTVLMAVRNGGSFLPAAVESILHQTYLDFRFLVVDDASTDQTRERLRDYASKDPRLELLCLEQNVGQTAALNIGLKRAQSPWIARMDADDYSHPSRLMEQMRALERNPGVGCIGTAIWEFRQDPNVVERITARPADPEAIGRAVLHGSGMIHGSIVVSREALLGCGAYDERYRYASDRDMFFRLLRKTRGMNLQEPLLGVRRHAAQDSFSRVAADEYVDLFERQLAGDGYSPQERRILRRSLATSHLFRARCSRKHGDYSGWMADQTRALKISPRTWTRNALAALAGPALSARLQAMKKKEFWK